MGISARNIGAIATKEMQTCRDAFWCGIMREMATITSRMTSSIPKIVLAHGDLVRIVDVGATWSFWTLT